MSGTILPFVEGQSEEEAIPILLRRMMLTRFGRPDVQVARPFRVKRNKVVRPGELERAVIQGVRDRADVVAVLVVLDADDDDPLPLEASLLSRCRQVTPLLPVAVVVAQRELEAWFLGCKDALRGFRGIRVDANAPEDPESIRGAKERLSRNMEGRRYLEVADQPAFVDRMDLELTLQRCASFLRLEAALREILRAL